MRCASIPQDGDFGPCRSFVDQSKCKLFLLMEDRTSFHYIPSSGNLPSRVHG